MKFYVLGFIFNKEETKVLLVQKNKPEWQKGRWNGIGGKIWEKNETPLQAMARESEEETGRTGDYWEHTLTFVCPGGTVFVYRTFSTSDEIFFEQVEDERLETHPVENLPGMLKSNNQHSVVNDVKWMIPVCLSNLQMPLVVQQNKLG